MDDLFELAEWKSQDPEVPDGDWHRDFGTFKLCGRGKFPTTSLMPGSLPRESDYELLPSDCVHIRRVGLDSFKCGRPKWPLSSARASMSTGPTMLTTVRSFGAVAMMATPLIFLFSART